MKIRKARESDMQSLLFIDRNCGFPMPQYSFAKEHFSKFLKKEIVFIIEDKKPVGFAILKKNFRDGSELYAICVIKACHGKGVGTKILGRVIKEASKYGKKKLYSYVWQKNFRSIAFHNKNNFYVVELSNKHYSGGETAVLFCRDL